MIFFASFERAHVALFIAITVIGCIFCLVHLPQAAVCVAGIVTVAYLGHYLLSGSDVYRPPAPNAVLWPAAPPQPASPATSNVAEKPTMH